MKEVPWRRKPNRKVDQLLDSLLEGKQPGETLGDEGLLAELTKRLVERALETEMTSHLGYAKHAGEDPIGRHVRKMAGDEDGDWLTVVRCLRRHLVCGGSAHNEIGLRLALGAQPRDVIAMIVRQSGRVVAAGVIIGIAAAAGGARVLQALLFGVAWNDVWTYAVADVGLFAVSLLACWLPARRAAGYRSVRTKARSARRPPPHSSHPDRSLLAIMRFTARTSVSRSWPVQCAPINAVAAGADARRSTSPPMRSEARP